MPGQPLPEARLGFLVAAQLFEIARERERQVGPARHRNRFGKHGDDIREPVEAVVQVDQPVDGMAVAVPARGHVRIEGGRGISGPFGEFREPHARRVVIGTKLGQMRENRHGLRGLPGGDERLAATGQQVHVVRRAGERSLEFEGEVFEAARGACRFRQRLEKFFPGSGTVGHAELFLEQLERLDVAADLAQEADFEVVQIRGEM